MPVQQLFRQAWAAALPRLAAALLLFNILVLILSFIYEKRNVKLLQNLDSLNPVFTLNY